MCSQDNFQGHSLARDVSHPLHDDAERDHTQREMVCTIYWLHFYCSGVVYSIRGEG